MDEIETLYRQHASAVFRFAWGLCGDRASAEDIVSETFVPLLTRPPRIETRTARAYLLTIARNIFINGLRAVAGAGPSWTKTSCDLEVVGVVTGPPRPSSCSRPCDFPQFSPTARNEP